MILDNGFICSGSSLSQCLLQPLFCDCNVLLEFWGSLSANAQNVNVYGYIWLCGILLQLIFLRSSEEWQFLFQIRQHSGDRCLVSTIAPACSPVSSPYVNFVIPQLIEWWENLKVSATGFIVKRDTYWWDVCPFRVTGYCSLADIVVATPGRLTDHINQTPGFSLAQLRFLVSHPHSPPIWELCVSAAAVIPACFLCGT